MKKRVRTVVKVILFIAIFVFIVRGMSALEDKRFDGYREKLVKVPNCELVEVEYGEKSSLFGYSSAVGYMDCNDIVAFINDTLNSNVKIYHPYESGEFILIKGSEIVYIHSMTEEEFVRKIR